MLSESLGIPCMDLIVFPWFCFVVFFCFVLFFDLELLNCDMFPWAVGDQPYLWQCGGLNENSVP